MSASLIGNAFGNDDKTFATLGFNVAAYAKYFGPAIGLELPGPGWVDAAVAGTYDLGILGVTYLECKRSNGGSDDGISPRATSTPNGSRGGVVYSLGCICAIVAGNHEACSFPTP
jgi:hypothetical protein